MRRRALAVAVATALPLLALLAPHAGGDAARPAPPRFAHEAHVARGVAIDACGACHVLAPDGRAAPPTSGDPHQPCATSGCHQPDFFSRTPTICGVCHDGDAIDPSAKQVARYAERTTSEFGGEISHKSHATARAGADNGACVACHGDVFRGTAPPDGHAVCAPCHAATAKPAMATCGGCHRRGVAGAPARRQPSPWSVAARFRHTSHGVDPTSRGETACTTCHAGVATAERTRDLAPPTMASCDRCHDGKAAFKTTGFECAKCHAPR